MSFVLIDSLCMKFVSKVSWSISGDLAVRYNVDWYIVIIIKVILGNYWNIKYCRHCRVHVT